MTKTSLRCYAAWDWQKNEADLNRLGQAGWRLEKAGFLRYTFAQDPKTHWTYAVDYCPRDTWPGEWQRRRRAAEKAGWKLVSHTRSGWAYFRSPAGGRPYPRSYTPDQEKLLAWTGFFFWPWFLVLAAGAAGAVVAVAREKAMAIPAVGFLAVALGLYFGHQAFHNRLKPAQAPAEYPAGGAGEPAKTPTGGESGDAPSETGEDGAGEP